MFTYFYFLGGGGGVNNDIYKALKKYFNLRISVENNKIPIFGRIGDMNITLGYYIIILYICITLSYL